MKRSLVLLLAWMVIGGIPAQAQNRTLKKVLELKMPRTIDDDMPGTRGASVCWNPVNKKYYAVFAGNASFPLGVFSADGKLLSADELSAEQDVRGLWYNPVTKKISGNGYNTTGWFSYELDKDGIPISANVDFPGMNQPDEQSVGACVFPSKSICFLNKGKISFYDMADGTPTKSVSIHWGRKKSEGPADGESDENENTDYNTTTLIYTGIKGAEIGLLNKTVSQIELYNIADGFLSQKLILPETAKLEGFFNFAFANGIYWLFDIENRVWIGYK